MQEQVKLCPSTGQECDLKLTSVETTTYALGEKRLYAAVWMCSRGIKVKTLAPLE